MIDKNREALHLAGGDSSQPRWVVVPYRQEWPDRFLGEAHRLTEALSALAPRIEHVGSTAVPGLGAKPIIDILAGVARIEDVRPRIEALQALGYHYVPKYEAELPFRRYFRKPATRPREAHLHIVPIGGEFWRDHLLFRDHLRRNPATAQEYYRLKVRLARECSRSGSDYSEAKTPFIQRVLELARQEACDSRSGL